MGPFVLFKLHLWAVCDAACSMRHPCSAVFTPRGGPRKGHPNSMLLTTPEASLSDPAQWSEWSSEQAYHKTREATPTPMPVPGACAGPPWEGVGCPPSLSHAFCHAVYQQTPRGCCLTPTMAAAVGGPIPTGGLNGCGHSRRTGGLGVKTPPPGLFHCPCRSLALTIPGPADQPQQCEGLPGGQWRADAV